MTNKGMRVDETYANNGQAFTFLIVPLEFTSNSSVYGILFIKKCIIYRIKLNAIVTQLFNFNHELQFEKMNL